MVKKIGGIMIAMDEVLYSMDDGNRHYTADFINLLLYSLNCNNIKIYPAISKVCLNEYYERIQEQKERYGFIPMDIISDEKKPCRNNYWVALIVDTENKQIFYLDPEKKLEKKTDIPENLLILKENVLKYEKQIMINPINFAQNGMCKNWGSHCGIYVVEMFKIFSNYTDKIIVDTECLDQDIFNGVSVSIQTILKLIKCEKTENIMAIREEHVQKAYNAMSSRELLSTPKTNTNNNSGVYKTYHY
jgi:hypothetical protein